MLDFKVGKYTLIHLVVFQYPDSVLASPGERDGLSGWQGKKITDCGR